MNNACAPNQRLGPDSRHFVGVGERGQEAYRRWEKSGQEADTQVGSSWWAGAGGGWRKIVATLCNILQ